MSATASFYVGMSCERSALFGALRAVTGKGPLHDVLWNRAVDGFVGRPDYPGDESGCVSIVCDDVDQIRAALDVAKRAGAHFVYVGGAVETATDRARVSIGDVLPGAVGEIVATGAPSAEAKRHLDAIASALHALRELAAKGGA